MTEPVLPWILAAGGAVTVLALLLPGWVRETVTNRQNTRRLRERFGRTGTDVKARR